MAVTSVLFVLIMVDNFIPVYQTDDITYFIWQSPSWEADSSSATLEIALLLWTHLSLLHYLQHSSSAVLPEQVSPIHTLTFCFFNIHWNVILPSTLAVPFPQVLP